MKTAPLIIIAALAASLLLLSCDNDDHEFHPPQPVTATIRGIVRSDSGAVAGVRLHVVYQLDTLDRAAESLPASPPVPPVSHRQEIVINDAQNCAVAFYVEFIPVQGAIRINLYSLLEQNLSVYELLRNDTLHASVRAVNRNGHLYFMPDTDVTPGTRYVYNFRMTCLDNVQLHAQPVEVTASHYNSVPSFALYTAAPNPVRSDAEVRFDLAASAPVWLTLHDANRRLRRTFVDSTFTYWGPQSVTVNLDSLPNGLYDCRLRVADAFKAQRKLLKNQTDYDRLSELPPSDVSTPDGRFEFVVAAGDTVALVNPYGGSEGLAVLRRVSVVALSSGFAGRDTLLTLERSQTYDLDLLLHRE